MVLKGDNGDEKYNDERTLLSNERTLIMSVHWTHHCKECFHFA